MNISKLYIICIVNFILQYERGKEDSLIKIIFQLQEKPLKIKGFIYLSMLAVRTNNLFLALLVKIKVLVAYVVSKNYVVVILLIILSYTALFPINGITNNYLIKEKHPENIFIKEGVLLLMDLETMLNLKMYV